MSTPRVSLLPSLPPVPTQPMAVADRRMLAEALGSMKRHMQDPAAQQHAKEGYARVWLHLVLSRGLDPRKAIAVGHPGFQAVLPAFLDAAERMGLHSRPQASWWVPEVSQIACALWRKARTAQGEAPQPLPGLGLDPIGSTKPGWLMALGSAAAADSRR